MFFASLFRQALAVGITLSLVSDPVIVAAANPEPRRVAPANFLLAAIVPPIVEAHSALDSAGWRVQRLASETIAGEHSEELEFQGILDASFSGPERRYAPERRALLGDLLTQVASIMGQAEEPNAVPVSRLVAFQKAIDHYNAQPVWVDKTGPLSIPLVFSLFFSPYANSTIAEHQLLEAIRRVNHLPEPYRTEIALFHLMQLGFHEGNYTTSESFDLEAVRALLPVALQSLHQSNDSARARRIDSGIAVVLLTFGKFPHYVLKDSMTADDLKNVLALLGRQRTADRNSRLSLGSFRVTMGSHILALNVGLKDPIDQILLDPHTSVNQPRVMALLKKQLARNGDENVTATATHFSDPARIAQTYLPVMDALRKIMDRTGEEPIVTIEIPVFLRRLIGDGEVHVKSNTPEEAIRALAARYPPVKKYLLDQNQRLLPTIRLFINDEEWKRSDIQTPLRGNDRISLSAAIIGGSGAANRRQNVDAEPMQAKPFPTPTLNPGFDSSHQSFLNRHEAQWRFLAKHVLPPMIARAKLRNPYRLRVLVLGASTGEELARTFHELVHALKSAGERMEDWDLDIDGVERDSQVVRVAENRLNGLEPFNIRPKYLSWESDDPERYADDIMRTLNEYPEAARKSFHMHRQSFMDIQALEPFSGSDLILVNNALHQTSMEDRHLLNNWLYAQTNTTIAATSEIGPNRREPHLVRPSEHLMAEQHYFFLMVGSIGEAVRQPILRHVGIHRTLFGVLRRSA